MGAAPGGFAATNLVDCPALGRLELSCARSARTGAGLCVPATTEPAVYTAVQPRVSAQPVKPSGVVVVTSAAGAASPAVRPPSALRNGTPGSAAKWPPSVGSQPASPADFGPQRSETPERTRRGDAAGTAQLVTSSLSDSSEPKAPKRWQRGDMIGVGAFGRVYVGLDEDTGTLLAVKEVCA